MTAQAWSQAPAVRMLLLASQACRPIKRMPLSTSLFSTKSFSACWSQPIWRTSSPRCSASEGSGATGRPESLDFVSHGLHYEPEILKPLHDPLTDEQEGEKKTMEPTMILSFSTHQTFDRLSKSSPVFIATHERLNKSHNIDPRWRTHLQKSSRTWVTDVQVRMTDCDNQRL